MGQGHLFSGERLGETRGEECAKHALRIEHDAAGLRLHGWIAQPVYSRASADQQYLYVNGRSIRDRSVAHAVKQAYADVLFHGRQRRTCCSSSSTPSVSTSTCIRPSTRCASATRGWCTTSSTAPCTTRWRKPVPALASRFPRMFPGNPAGRHS